jgi:hypothetical protein
MSHRQRAPRKKGVTRIHFLTLEECTLFCFRVETAFSSETSASLYLSTWSGIPEDNKRPTHYVVKCHKHDMCQQTVNTTSLVKYVKCCDMHTVALHRPLDVWEDVSKLSNEQFGLISANDLFMYFSQWMNYISATTFSTQTGFHGFIFQTYIFESPPVIFVRTKFMLFSFLCESKVYVAL